MLVIEDVQGPISTKVQRPIRQHKEETNKILTVIIQRQDKSNQLEIPNLDKRTLRLSNINIIITTEVNQGSYQDAGETDTAG